MAKRTIATRMTISGDNFRRRCAKNILKNKTKRIRHKEHLLTVEETERMTEFLMKEEQATNGRIDII